MSRCQLAGSIPSTLYSLSGLKHLDLSENELSGSIPDKFASLPLLRFLALDTNQLSGPIPPSIGKLSRLRLLSLGFNLLSGGIPRSLGMLPNLQYLSLTQNALTGTIPAALGNASRLLALDLSYNSLYGPVPSTLSALPSIIFLDFSNNVLYGFPPSSFPSLSIANLSLSTYDISHNFFSGWANVTAQGTSFCPQRLQGGFIRSMQGVLPRVQRRAVGSLADNCLMFLQASGAGGLKGSAGGDNACAKEEQKDSDNCQAFCGSENPSGPCAGYGLCFIAASSASIAQPNCLCNAGFLSSVEFGEDSDGDPVAYPTCIPAPPSGTFSPPPPTSNGKAPPSPNGPPAPAPAPYVPSSVAVQKSSLLSLKNIWSIQEEQWDREEDYCEWVGVQCDSKGNVLQLNVANSRIRGVLPAPLFLLSFLQVLQLDFNFFSGSIPDSFSQMPYLSKLTLSNCRLTGPLPSSLGSLSHLLFLDLSSNLLSYSIPEGFGNAPALQSIDLHSNQLTGSIPNSLLLLKNLTTLSLYDNQLQGSIPSTVGNLTNLQYLLLGSNVLTGTIPDAFNSLRSVLALDLSKNRLVGPIPPSLVALPSLVYLDLSANMLSGSAPSSFLSASIGDPFQGTYDVSRNYFTGSPIVTCVGGGGAGTFFPFCPNDQYESFSKHTLSTLLTFSPAGGSGQNCLDKGTDETCSTGNQRPFEQCTAFCGASYDSKGPCAGNGICGPLPSSQGQSSAFVCACNTGFVSQVTSTENGEAVFSTCVAASQANNGSSATLVPNITAPPVQDNQLSTLLSLKASLGIRNSLWPSSSSSLYCSTWAGVACDSLGNVVQLNLQNLQISSSISGLVFQLGFLQVLALDNNALGGEIPNNFSSLPNLVTLSLSNCALVGSLPSSLTSLIGLKNLDLGSNFLSGAIPDLFKSLHSLQSLYIDFNQLSGPIPTSMGSLRNLTVLSLVGNSLSGPIPDLSSLASLQYLMLSSNALQGTFPSSLSAVSSLVALDLSQNQLYGTVPSGIFRNWTAITYMDLSDNQFTGAPPSSFPSSSIASPLRSTLNIARNYFTGNASNVIFAAGVEVCPPKLKGAFSRSNLLRFKPSIGGTMQENCLKRSMTKAKKGGTTSGTEIDISCSREVQREVRECAAFCGSTIGPSGPCAGHGECSLVGSSSVPTCQCNKGYVATTLEISVADLIQGDAGGDVYDFDADELGNVSYSTCIPGSPSSPFPPPMIQNLNFSTGLSYSTANQSSPAVPSSSSAFNRFSRFLSAGYTGNASSPFQWEFNASMDWRKMGYVPDIQDQGTCSSCWVFAPLAAIESALAIAFSSSPPLLSKQQVLDCQGTGTCQGGWPNDAFAFVAKSLHGIAPEKQYPYNKLFKAGSCKATSFSRRLLSTDPLLSLLSLPQYSKKLKPPFSPFPPHSPYQHSPPHTKPKASPHSPFVPPHHLSQSPAPPAHRPRSHFPPPQFPPLRKIRAKASHPPPFAHSVSPKPKSKAPPPFLRKKAPPHGKGSPPTASSSLPPPPKQISPKPKSPIAHYPPPKPKRKLPPPFLAHKPPPYKQMKPRPPVSPKPKSSPQPRQPPPNKKIRQPKPPTPARANSPPLKRSPPKRKPAHSKPPPPSAKKEQHPPPTPAKTKRPPPPRSPPAKKVNHPLTPPPPRSPPRTRSPPRRKYPPPRFLPLQSPPPSPARNKFLLPPYHIQMFEQVDFNSWFGMVLAVRNQPIIANIEADHESFLNYQGGFVYNDPDCFLNRRIDHTITLVGYDLSASVPFWIVRNSWGKQWGEGGYMRMALIGGDGMCGVNSQPALYPVVRGPDPCSPLNPCGDGQCTALASGLNLCDCGEIGAGNASAGNRVAFTAVTNVDGSQSCALVSVCAFFSRNPCVVGSCVDDSSGGFSCACPFGFVNATRADGTSTCIPGSSGQSYTVLVGQTCKMIAQLYGLTVKQFKNLNQGVNCSNLTPGTSLIVANPNYPGCALPYSVSMMETCNTIATLFGSSLSLLLSNNPGLDCSALFPGQEICIQQGSPSYSSCHSFHNVKRGETCQSIASSIARPPLSLDQFYALNPGINCNAISSATGTLLETQVCIQSFPIGSTRCLSGQYFVKRGDTCPRILFTLFHGNVRLMLKFNPGFVCINRLLYVGMKLCLSPPNAGNVY